LSIKNPRNLTQSLVKEIATGINRGKALVKLDLIGVKYLNKPKNFEALCENLLYLSELKYLNVSDNAFKPN
jgi:hypothetical protein